MRKALVASFMLAVALVAGAQTSRVVPVSFKMVDPAQAPITSATYALFTLRCPSAQPTVGGQVIANTLKLLPNAQTGIVAGQLYPNQSLTNQNAYVVNCDGVNNSYYQLTYYINGVPGPTKNYRVADTVVVFDPSQATPLASLPPTGPNINTTVNTMSVLGSLKLNQAAAGCLVTDGQGVVQVQAFPCGGNGTGTIIPNGGFPFVSTKTLTILGTDHKFSNPNISTTCWLSGTPVTKIVPQGESIDTTGVGANPPTYDIHISFAVPATGYCVVNGGSDPTSAGNFVSVTGQTIGGAAYATKYPGGDIGAQVNNAINSFTGGCGEVVISNGTYLQTTPIIKPRCTNLHGQSSLGTILNWGSISGAAIIAADSNSQGSLAAGNLYAEGSLSDLTIIGPVPNGVGTTNVGVFVGGDPSGTLSPATAFGDHQNFNRVRFFSLGTGIQWGNHAFMTTIFESLFSNNQTGYYYPTGLNDSGESITTLRTSIQNNVTGMNIPGYADFFFYGSSCDYNTTCGIVSGAQFFGEHFEQLSGVILTIQGQATPTVNIYGGWALEQCPTGATNCSGTTEPYMFHVTATPPSQPNPHLLIDGTYLQANHLFTNVIGWEATGASSSVAVRDLPLYNSNAMLPSMLSVPCTFIGCRLDTGQGNYAWSALASKLDDNGNLVLNTVSTANGPVLSDILGFAAITGNYDTSSGTGGLAVYAMPGAPVSYFTPMAFNNFGKRVITNDVAIGSNALVPIVFGSQSVPPTGSCNNGSTIANTSGSFGSTNFDCEGGTYVARHPIGITGTKTIGTSTVVFANGIVTSVTP